jgi:hypothetical protein
LLTLALFDSAQKEGSDKRWRMKRYLKNNLKKIFKRATFSIFKRTCYQGRQTTPSVRQWRE